MKCLCNLMKLPGVTLWFTFNFFMHFIHPIVSSCWVYLHILQTIVILIRDGRYDLCLLRKGNKVFWRAFGKHFMVPKMYNFSAYDFLLQDTLLSFVNVVYNYTYVMSHLLHYLFSSQGYLDNMHILLILIYSSSTLIT